MSTASLPPPFSSAGLPLRARAILARLHALSTQILETPLRLTVVELERELFRLAERAGNSQTQGELYAQTRLLRERAEQFAPAMLAALATSLVQVRLPESATNARGDAGGFRTLTLVDDLDIDRDIALHEVARRDTSRHATALRLVGQRFGVIGTCATVDAEQLPLGPYGLYRALRAAGEAIDLSPDAQLQLYRVFEQQCGERMGALFERANALLSDEGVLPGLVFQPYLARPAGTRRTAPPVIPGAQAGVAAGTKPAAAAPRTAARPSTSWSGQAPAAAWGESMQDGPAAAAAASAAPPASSASGTHKAPATTPQLQSLLDAARAMQATAASGSTGAADAAAMPASALPTLPVQPEAMHDALAMLQARSGAGHPMPPSNDRSVGDLRQQLLALLRESQGPQAALTPQQDDTVDLLGMLYQQIGHEVRSESPANALLVRMQVPVLRAALQDPAFFVHDAHPARDLLNAVAEAGAVWQGEDDVDPQLLQKLSAAVDTVVGEYHGDDAVFEHAHEDIQAHQKALARKAEVAERRHVEAARGRERLELAKRKASDSVEQLCTERAPPKFVQSLLRQAWSDVLTLTLLRQGEQSPDWSGLRQLTDRIADVTCRPAGGETDADLGNDVERALLHVGYHREEAGAIARRLSTPGGEDELTSRTELTAKLKARARLGDQTDAVAIAEPARPPRSTSEQACHAQLRELPFGTWFEFVINQQGDLRRQRLSWYSPVTDHALFVNQRGQKLAEHSLDTVARLMASGQARIVTEEKARLVDRAWQATVRTLRALAGNRPARQEMPA